MRLVAGHPIVAIGAEPEQLAALVLFGLHLDGEKRRVIDADTDLFDRGHEKVLAVLALENRREQADQCGTSDWRSSVEPRGVAPDPHVDIAAEWRIP